MRARRALSSAAAAPRARAPLRGSPEGALVLGDAGVKGFGVFAARRLAPGTLLLRDRAAAAGTTAASVAAAGAAATARGVGPTERGATGASAAAAGAAGAGPGAAPQSQAYVLDAPVPLPELDEEAAAAVRRFPFLADPRLWAAVCAPRSLGALDLEGLHHRLAAPFAVRGGAAFTEHALLNHSCCPEVVRYFVGDSLVLRSARTVEAEEEVSDTYFFPLAPLHVRAKACEAFHFECHCPRCTAEAALPRQLHVWGRLTWTNTLRLLGEVAHARARARGAPEALRASGAVHAAVGQLEGLVAGTEGRLRALGLPEAELAWCLSSWACAAAAVGDLRASVRGDLAAAAQALAQAAHWAVPTAPGQALGYAGRAAAYRAAAGEAAAAAADVAEAVALHRRCLCEDHPEVEEVLATIA